MALLYIAVACITVLVWIAIQFAAKHRTFLAFLFQPRENVHPDPRIASKERTKRDGSVYVTYFGRRPVVVLAGSDACAEFYSNVKVVIRKRALDLGYLFDRFIGDCLGALTGKRWTIVKRAFQSAMLKMQSNESITVIHNEITRWERDVLDPLASSGDGIDAVALVGDMPQRVVQSIFFGEQFVDQHQPVLHDLAAMSKKIVTDVFCNPFANTWFYRFLPTPTNKTLREFHRGMVQLVEWYDMQDEKTRELGVLHLVHREKITNREFLETLAEIIFVNLDVSVPTTAWLIVHLALHPDKLITEHATTFTDKALHEPEGNALEFVQESARFAPIAYMSTQQLSDCEVFGYPAGTSFCVDFVSLNRDEKVWANPNKFDPTRFEVDDENREFGYMRFGMATRKCPGRHVADILLSAVATRCARRYNLRLASIDAKSSDEVPLHDGPFISPRAEISVTWKPVLSGCSKFGHSPIFTGVSITPTSPFRNQRKADAFLRFLASAGQPVTIILPDTLTRYNVMAFEHKSEKQASRISRKQGEEIYNNLINAWKSQLDDEARERVQLWRMGELESDEIYQRQLATFRSHYTHDERFQNMLKAVAHRYIKIRGRGFAESDQRFRYAVEYILGELPILICGVNMAHKGVHCSQLVYSSSRDHLEKFEQPRPDSLLTLKNRLQCDESFKALRIELEELAEPGCVLLPI